MKITGPSLALFVASGAASVVAAAASEGEQIGFPGDDVPGRVRAMTMNVYLGADLFRLTRLLTDPADPCLASHGGDAQAAVPCAASEIWDNFLATDFPSRAKVLADHIERAAPDVLGLQEVLTASTGPFDPTVTEPRADEVVQDYLQILQDELRSRSLSYDVAAKCTIIDGELPAYNDPHDASSGGFNGRSTVRTVLLVNAGTSSHSNGDALTFEANLSVPGTSLSFSYCAAMADVTVREGASPYRAVAAHLITPDRAEIQNKQANELVNSLSSTDLPQIVMADLNADPGYVMDFPSAYEVMTGWGYEDMMLDNRNDGDTSNPEGLTHGHNGTLTNQEEEFTSRLDYVLYKGFEQKMAWMDTFGDDPADSRTADGKLWASDHAAVFADLVPWTAMDEEDEDGAAPPPTVLGEGGATSSPAPTGSPVADEPSAGRNASAMDSLVLFVAGFVCAAMGLSML